MRQETYRKTRRPHHYLGAENQAGMKCRSENCPMKCHEHRREITQTTPPPYGICRLHRMLKKAA